MNKRLLLAFALLSAAPAAYAQDKAPRPSLKALDEKNGFRTHHFGDDVSQFSDLTIAEDDGDVKYYTSTDENLKIGGATIQRIAYGFYKGKFYELSIKTEDYTNSRALFEALKAQYGMPYRANQYIEDYNWFGKLVSLGYDENSINGSAKVIMYSKPISKQEDADKKAVAKKAGSDL